MTEKDIEKLIICGNEVEMVDYNSRFRGYECFDWKQQLRIQKKMQSLEPKLL